MKTTMYDEILALLQSSGLTFTLHEHVPSYTFEDAKALPFPLERLLKTIAFRRKAGAPVLVALRGQDRVDYRKLAEAMGARRADIVRMSPEEVLEAFGVEVGSVGPIPMRADVPLLFDVLVPAAETVFCGIGRPDRTLEIRLADLAQLTHGRILPISADTTET
jgi:Cys-tRNA(Pro)/Cys-tRNA(Cys) deacylase